MSEVKISLREAELIDKALRLYRDRQYRHESEVKPETYEKSVKLMAQCDELRHRILKEAYEAIEVESSYRVAAARIVAREEAN